MRLYWRPCRWSEFEFKSCRYATWFLYLSKIFSGNQNGYNASDLPRFVSGCIDTAKLCVNVLPKTIHLFGAAYPPFLSSSNASALLPYLKNASSVSDPHGLSLYNSMLQSEELPTSDYLLKKFRVSMPKTAA